jgi:hypothetical protein
MTLASRLSALAQAVGADIKGLNTLLGANPQGTAASVAARLANIEAGNTPASPHGLAVYRAANLVLASGTLTTISWDTILADNADGNWSAANPSRLTALKAGWYTFNARILYPANATGQRTFQWAVNGNTVAREDHNAPSNAASNVAFSSSVTVYLAVGDYLELKVSQNSGASLTVAGATAATASISHRRRLRRAVASPRLRCGSNRSVGYLAIFPGTWYGAHARPQGRQGRSGFDRSRRFGSAYYHSGGSYCHVDYSYVRSVGRRQRRWAMGSDGSRSSNR